MDMSAFSHHARKDGINSEHAYQKCHKILKREPGSAGRSCQAEVPSATRTPSFKGHTAAIEGTYTDKRHSLLVGLHPRADPVWCGEQGKDVEDCCHPWVPSRAPISTVAWRSATTVCLWSCFHFSGLGRSMISSPWARAGPYRTVRFTVFKTMKVAGTRKRLPEL